MRTSTYSTPRTWLSRCGGSAIGSTEPSVDGKTIWHEVLTAHRQAGTVLLKSWQNDWAKRHGQGVDQGCGRAGRGLGHDRVACLERRTGEADRGRHPGEGSPGRGPARLRAQQCGAEPSAPAVADACAD